LRRKLIAGTPQEAFFSLSRGIVEILRTNLVFSPKGWDSIAQGNALGFCVGDLQPEGLRQALSQAFSLENKSNR